MWEIEKQHKRTAKVIYRLNTSIKDENVLKVVNWQDLGYICKRKIAIYMHKVTFDYKRRIAQLYSLRRKQTRKGTQFQMKKMKTKLGK